MKNIFALITTTIVLVACNNNVETFSSLTEEEDYIEHDTIYVNNPIVDSLQSCITRALEIIDTSYLFEEKTIMTRYNSCSLLYESTTEDEIDTWLYIENHCYDFTVIFQNCEHLFTKENN